MPTSSAETRDCPHLHMEERFQRVSVTDPIALQSYWWCHDCNRVVNRGAPSSAENAGGEAEEYPSHRAMRRLAAEQSRTPEPSGAGERSVEAFAESVYRAMVARKEAIEECIRVVESFDAYTRMGEEKYARGNENAKYCIAQQLRALLRDPALPGEPCCPWPNSNRCCKEAHG